MDYIYESIKFSKTFPVNLFVHKVNYVQNHWHESIELLFILSGRVSLSIGNFVYELKEEDIIVINSSEIHSTSSLEDNIILALQIPVDYLKAHFECDDGLRFNCKSFLFSGNQQDRFNQIRTNLAEMLWTYSKNERGSEFKLQSILLELLYILYRDFSIEAPEPDMKSNEKYFDRLSRIIHYINENYSTDISLNSLAKQEYLSVSYLSKFFKKYVGTTFLDYLNSIRLEHAVKDLIYTEHPISQIVLQNGFPNEISFLNLFKKVYGDTPRQYRKKTAGNVNVTKVDKKSYLNYYELANTDIFKHLLKYLKPDSGPAREKPDIVFKDLGSVDVNATGTRIFHNWKNLITIGKAKEGLIAEVQRQLQQVQAEIGFRYIRFHGIFDDEMMVYEEDDMGNPILNFSYVDSLFLFFQSIGLRPFIELGFMPSKLAKSQKTVFYNSSTISMPKDMKKWNYLVRSFILHCIEHFGKEEVEQWYFEFWNEPDMKHLFWFDSDEDYLSFYESTYRTIKGISLKLRLGGPATFVNHDHGLHCLRNYLQFCSVKDCSPDFISIHCYPDILHHNPLRSTGDSHPVKTVISEDENLLHHSLDVISGTVEHFGFNNGLVHITEWNSTAWHRDLTNDTCYKAAYIVKNLVNNMDLAASFGYWSLTDFMEEMHASHLTFHGGLGLITSNGLKKAAYHAFWMLNRLGTHVLQSGDGYYITSSNSGYQVLFYNYCHFDKLYGRRDTSAIDLVSRYDVFQNDHAREISLRLKGLMEGLYLIKEYCVNRDHGSTFDQWVAMGSPEYLSSEDLMYLKNKSALNYKKHKVNISSEFQINTDILPHEVKLYEISLIPT